jgi:hypothetical protein
MEGAGSVRLTLTRRDRLDHHVEVITQIPVELTALYGAFRRERHVDDALTPGHLGAFPAFDDRPMGLNPDLSRRVRAADGTAAYLVPGDGVVAIIDERTGGGSVIGIQQALDGTGISTSFRGTGRLQIDGLLPDGVDAITIVRRNSDEIGLQVPDHLYAAEVYAEAPEELPDVVRFNLDGREQRLRVPGADDEILSLRPPSP